MYTKIYKFLTFCILTDFGQFLGTQEKVDYRVSKSFENIRASKGQSASHADYTVMTTVSAF